MAILPPTAPALDADWSDLLPRLWAALSYRPKRRHLLILSPGLLI